MTGHKDTYKIVGHWKRHFNGSWYIHCPISKQNRLLGNVPTKGQIALVLMERLSGGQYLSTIKSWMTCRIKEVDPKQRYCIAQPRERG